MAVACDLTRARTPDNTLPYLGKRLLAVTAPDFDFCTRPIDGTFPNYESQILPASPKAVTCPRAELLAALHRLSAVCNAPPPLVALSWRSEGRLCVVLARQPDDGSDMIDAQAAGAARIAVLLRQIVGLIGNFDCESLRLEAGAEEPLVIVGEAKLALIMRVGYEREVP
jgi:DNA polymerase III sliding clamp (beta) subunit (PCNA family)